MSHEILIIDDEPDIRLLIEGVLRDEGYETRTAGDSDAALAAFRLRRPSLVILDIWLQGSKLDGLGILEALQSEEPHVPVVMISGHGTIETAVSAIQRGAYDFIEKPFKSDRLILIVRRALEAARLAREVAELRLRAGAETELAGESPMIGSVRSAIERVAPTGSRVLISGPPGSGKEVAARMIHARSRRADGPFVALNCAALNPMRFEEELFGVEGSADTIAHPRRTGMLERAHGGTLLLDEVSDMPLETQGKIVRALQDQTFERLGGSIRVKVDVRVLAATNRDLQNEINAGRFREDLYYRLAVVPLRMPALKERREDIPLLARHYLRAAARELDVEVKALAPQAERALAAYGWPGNVRELVNLCRRLSVLAPGSEIRAEDLPQEIVAGAAIPQSEWQRTLAAWAERVAVSSEGALLDLALPEFERTLIRAALKQTQGHRQEAAKLLGWGRNTLTRKLKELSLEIPGDKGGTSDADES